MDPASVTQLAYSHLSINNSPPASRKLGHSGGKTFFLPRNRFEAPAPAFRRTLRFHLPSATAALSPVPGGGAWWRCLVEVPGGGERDRTDDLLLAKQALSQLSYTPRARGRRSEIGGQEGAGLLLLTSDL